MRFDADEVHSLELYDCGHCLGAFDAATSTRPERGAASRWAAVLGIAPDRLLAEFERPAADLKATLIALCDGLGYAASTVLAPTGEGLMLQLRDRVRPSWQQRKLGPPSLSLPRPEPRGHEVGERFVLPFTAESTGGRGEGLTVLVSGLSSKAPIELETIEVKVVDPNTGAWRLLPGADAVGSGSLPGKPLRPGSGAPIDERMIVKIPDWPIPAALIGSSFEPGVPAAALTRAVFETWTTVVLHATARSPGEADVQVTLVPQEHPEGAATARQRCVIHPRFCRPLRMGRGSPWGSGDV